MMIVILYGYWHQRTDVKAVTSFRSLQSQWIKKQYPAVNDSWGWCQ